MKRLAFLLSKLDARDRMVIVGVLLFAMLTSFGVGCVTAAHRARWERERALEEAEKSARRMYEHRGWTLITTRRQP